MGLDTVELVLAFEEEFAVRIDDKDAVELTTPGLVADYIFSRLDRAGIAPCSSQARFHRLRRALADNFAIDRKAIRVETPLADLLGRDPKAKWRRLRNEIGARDFPRLQRHPVFLVSVVFAMPALLTLTPQITSVWFDPWRLAEFIMLSLLLNILTYPMGNRIPGKVATVGALVPFVRSPPAREWSRQEVLERIIELTAIQLGLQRREVREDSHFVRDLGAD